MLYQPVRHDVEFDAPAERRDARDGAFEHGEIDAAAEFVDQVETGAAKPHRMQPLELHIGCVVVDLGDAAKPVADLDQRVMDDAVVGAVRVGRDQHGTLDTGDLDDGEIML